jgi:hypothetical protein
MGFEEKKVRHPKYVESLSEQTISSTKRAKYFVYSTRILIFLRSAVKLRTHDLLNIYFTVEMFGNVRVLLHNILEHAANQTAKVCRNIEQISEAFKNNHILSLAYPSLNFYSLFSSTISNY